VYQNESGALNESLADCFGVMLKQWKLDQKDPCKADWVVGNGLFYKHRGGLRCINDPTIYNQPWHYSNYYNMGSWDNGGVHHNSGIVNHAFYLVAYWSKKPSWEVAGQIWYKTMIDPNLTSTATFEEFAKTTLALTSARWKEVVQYAWEKVGVLRKPDEGNK